MRIKRILLSSVLLLTSFSARAYFGPSLAFDRLAQKSLPTADVGILVKDLGTGKIIYEMNSHQAFAPASNAKLFTAAAALLYLGPDYTYTTGLYADTSQIQNGVLRGNVYIKFVGDPSLKSQDLTSLLSALKKQDIQQINGDVILDTTRFSANSFSEDSRINWTHWYYGAPITSVILNQNYMILSIKPASTTGDYASASGKKNALYSTVHSDVNTVNYDTAENHCALLIDVDDSNNVSLSGCWPISNGSSFLRIAMKNPSLFAAHVVATNLEKLGISLTGHVTTGVLPAHQTALAEHRSQNLELLLKNMMKKSNNIYAEAVSKTLGYEYFHNGTFQEGAYAIREILRRNLNIALNEHAFTDAAGLRDFVTPQQVVELLEKIYHNPTLNRYLIATLPIAGHDGTLRGRMSDKDVAGRVLAKTGTLDDVSALSGFIVTQRNRHLAFTILVNDVIGKTAPAHAFEDHVCKQLVRNV